MKQPFLLLSVAMLAATIAAFAAENPFLGTWKLNVAKSKLTSADGKELPFDVSEETITDEAVGDQIKLIDDWTIGGKRYHLEWIGRFDSKDYPSQNDPNSGTISYKMIDGRTLLLTTKRNGQMEATRRLTISPDGKTRTLTGTRKNGGQIVAVYDKQ